MDAQIPAKLTRSTCSFCAKRCALLAYCAPDQFHLTAHPADDAIYRWQTRQVAHHFCAHCGCATFSDSPAFEQDGKWDGATLPERCQGPAFRRLRCGARLDRSHRRQAPLVVLALD
ncbi:MAG: GFA family protein [Betaproteobacteria bacterium]